MKLPISKRLLCCAELVPPCGTVADVGTDHGYLGIYLLQNGRCGQCTQQQNAHRRKHPGRILKRKQKQPDRIPCCTAAEQCRSGQKELSGLLHLLHRR